jgi:hypothetical protein
MSLLSTRTKCQFCPDPRANLWVYECIHHSRVGFWVTCRCLRPSSKPLLVWGFLNNTSRKYYKTYALRRLVFETHVTVKWSNLLSVICHENT